MLQGFGVSLKELTIRVPIRDLQVTIRVPIRNLQGYYRVSGLFKGTNYKGSYNGSTRVPSGFGFRVSGSGFGEGLCTEKSSW